MSDIEREEFEHAFEKWINAAVMVANAESMADEEVIPTWPVFCVERSPELYPELTVGAVRAWQASRQALSSCSEIPNSSGHASRQALEGEAVAIVDRVGIMQRCAPYTNLEEGTKLYTRPASSDEWIKCSEQTPNLGQRVILHSKGVIQNYMPLFDQGDSDFGMGDHFWEFEDVNDIDNPLVNFEEDCWMPLPEPLKQEKSHD